MTEETARAACEEASRETGLPAVDPVRFDPTPLVDAVVGAREAYLEGRRRQAEPAGRGTSASAGGSAR
jgi:hypothetical protein